MFKYRISCQGFKQNRTLNWLWLNMAVLIRKSVFLYIKQKKYFRNVQSLFQSMQVGFPNNYLRLRLGITFFGLEVGSFIHNEKAPNYFGKLLQGQGGFLQKIVRKFLQGQSKCKLSLTFCLTFLLQILFEHVIIIDKNSFKVFLEH